MKVAVWTNSNRTSCKTHRAHSQDAALQEDLSQKFEKDLPCLTPRPEVWGKCGKVAHDTGLRINLNEITARPTSGVPEGLFSTMRSPSLFTSIALLVSLLWGARGFAQETLYPRAFQSLDQGIVYDREYTVAMTLNTNGFSLGVNSGKLKTYYKTSYWGGSLGLLRNPQEYRTTDRSVAFGQSSGSFVFGKRNSLIPARVYKGWKRYYSGKDRRRGVAVGTSFELGVTAGVIKPYVLEISSLTPDRTPERLFYTYEQNPEGFGKRGLISGSGGLKRGWSEASIIPGLNARAAVHLDWGAFDEFIKALDAGIMIDVYPRAVPILIEPAKNTLLFVNFYATVHLGRRR